jgi:EmrB/QacA subfamily drug resistance transporter
VAEQPAPADGARAAGHGALRLSLIVTTAFFMETLDGTVIVTALPKIGHSFGVAPIDLSLSITAYLLTLAAFIPTSPWFSDRFGSRTVFAGAVALFTLASMLCGLSTGFTTFIAARVLQGFAAALMAPVGRLVVLRNTPKNQLVRAMATLTWPALIAPVLGPPLGGFITTYADWRWIFFLNLPIGLAGVALALRFVPQEKAATRTRFDRLGFVLTAVALASFIYGLDLLSRRDADPPLAAALMAVGLLVGVAAVRHARRTAAPLLDFRGLAVRSFALSAITAGTLARISISATPFLLPLMFQIAYGLTPAQAGLLVLAYMAGNLAMKTITTPLLRWFGFRSVLVVNGLLSAAAIFACGLVSPQTVPPILYGVLFLAGAFRSMNFTAMNTLAFAEVAPEGRGGATALWGMTQQVAFSLGVAAAALALNLSLSLRGGQALAAADFRFAFAAMAALALVSALWFAQLHPDVAAEVSGHRRKGVD